MSDNGNTLPSRRTEHKEYKIPRMKKFFLYLLLIAAIVMTTSFNRSEIIWIQPAYSINNQTDTLQYPQEKHFHNVRQLTFGGDNAEAYFSFDGKWLIFQKTNLKDGILCDQIFIGKVPEKQGENFTPKLVSTGKGRTT